MVTLTDKISKVELSHRFMLEQRFVGRYTKPELIVEDDYLFKPFTIHVPHSNAFKGQ
jgi:hypothetical protein